MIHSNRTVTLAISLIKVNCVLWITDVRMIGVLLYYQKISVCISGNIDSDLITNLVIWYIAFN